MATTLAAVSSVTAKSLRTSRARGMNCSTVATGGSGATGCSHSPRNRRRATRAEHRHVGRGGKQFGDQGGERCDEMLGVVKEEQLVMLEQMVDHGLAQGESVPPLAPQRAGDRAGDERRGGQRGRRHPASAVVERVDQLASDL